MAQAMEDPGWEAEGEGLQQSDSENSAPGSVKSQKTAKGSGKGRGGRGRGRHAKSPGADRSRSRGRSPLGTPRKGGAKPKAGRKQKARDGMKCCCDCGKWKLVEEFSLRQPRCTSPCRHAYDNLRHHAKAQGQVKWFEEQWADEQKKSKLLHNYLHQRIKMKSSGKAKAPFDVMIFRQQVEAEEAWIRDGVFEMMHLVCFQEWCKKPKNVHPMGLSPQEAEREFRRRAELDDAIID